LIRRAVKRRANTPSTRLVKDTRSDRGAQAVACLLVLGMTGCKLFTGGDDEPPVGVCWQQPGPEGLALTRPAVVGDVVVFAEGDGSIVARDRRTGDVRWRTRVDTAGALGRNMVTGAGVVVVPVASHTAALDAATGQVRWRYEAPLDVRENPRAPRPGFVGGTRLDSDGVHAFVPSWGASVAAVDLATGVVRWTWTPGDTVPFRSGADGVRVSGDTVYATIWHYITALGGESEHWLVALDRLTGRELWRVVFPSYTGGVIFMGAPSVYGNFVVFMSVGGYSYAVDRFSRAVVWRFNPDPLQATLAQDEVYGDVVYHDGGDNFLYALRASDGTQLWKGPISGQPQSDFLVTDRHIYVAVGNKLDVLERKSGRRVAMVNPPRDPEVQFYTAPTYAAGRVFIGVKRAAVCFTEPR